MKKQKEEKLPTVSFVICTLNCREYLERCLKSIRAQNYPQKKVEIVIVDSYSTDGTIQTAKSFGSRVILTKIVGYMEGKGMPKSMGCEKAKGEIIITLDSDNALVEKEWIRNMVHPLVEDNEVNYCISRMSVVKKDPLANQYLSLVGTDPFAIYTSLDPQISLNNVKLKDKGKYYVYKQNLKDFLITGGYYVTIRKKTLKEIGGYSRDVDVAYTLAKRGMGNIAIPKNTHLHHLATRGFIDFFKKKIKWGKYYFSNPHSERDFNWASGLFGKHGQIRFSYEVLRNFLFFPAFLVSLKMLIMEKNKAWAVHAPMKFATTSAYIIAYLTASNQK
jgi:glycosyltransferase involved in cell wall biosynthesis